MRYTDLEGNEATGTVWAPGPLANTVWVFDAAGNAVVVKVPKGDVAQATEVEYEWPTLCTRWTILEWVRFADDPRKRTQAHKAADYRHAPKLSAKTWNACVGQQCTTDDLLAA